MRALTELCADRAPGEEVEAEMPDFVAAQSWHCH
jgi:hypothetical protein